MHYEAYSCIRCAVTSVVLMYNAVNVLCRLCKQQHAWYQTVSEARN